MVGWENAVRNLAIISSKSCAASDIDGSSKFLRGLFKISESDDGQVRLQDSRAKEYIP